MIRGYLAEAGRIATERGKQEEESTYGLTWKGFVAGLAIKKVRENAFQVLKDNLLLTLPLKEFVLLVLEWIVTPHELEIVAEYVLEPYLRAIPNLELIEEEQLLMFLFSMGENPRFSARGGGIRTPHTQKPVHSKIYRKS